MTQQATSTTPVPFFQVRTVPVYGDVILAPMAGYSDVPYRAICRAYGSAMNYTEFAPAVALASRKPNKYWSLLDRKPDEHPMVFQIFGSDPQKILAAAQRIEAWGPDLIDINMGCSTRRVSGRGAGVGLMREPRNVAHIFALLSRHIQVPVTAKMRLGWDDRINYLDVARALEENGAALIAMHGRTKEQKYGGKADWDAIAALKQTVSVPVIGSGDVDTPGAIDRMRLYTGCDAVMIGRAAIGNPWIFGRRRRRDLAFSELLTTVRLHLREMVAYYGDYGLVLFRKHLDRYLADLPVLAPLLEQMKQAREPRRLRALLREAESIAAVAGTDRLDELEALPLPNARPWPSARPWPNAMPSPRTAKPALSTPATKPR